MKTHRVTGGGGIQLNVVETGNPRGRPIVFIHGTSQCCLTWDLQLNSSLADSYRLVALDMRGHGLSDKPRDAYGDSKLWADDIHAVIQSLKLDHPVLSGWSYGPLIIFDYIRHYGEEEISGIQLIGGITKLGSDDAMSVFTPEFLSLVPQLFSCDVETSICGLSGLLRLCFVRPPSDCEMYQMLGYNLSVPPYVRQGMFSRAFDNDDLLPKISKPVLITHGGADAIVKPAIVDQHKRAMPHAHVDFVPDAGHAVFRDDAAGFNDRLRVFCESLR